MVDKSRPISAFRRRTAQRLRESTTGAEDLLWRHLRRIPIEGTHFRRQVPVGPYVADFACMAAKLIIEVDGSQHGLEPARRRDEQRTKWLEAEGFRVLRFWNNDVTADIDGVLEAIIDAIHGSSQPRPLIRRRRRRDAGRVKREDHPTPAHFVRRPSPSRGG